MSPPGFDPLSLPYYDPETDRRVAFVTGGNSGIGWYTVLELFLHGYVVYIAGRSKNRVLKSIKEIRERAATIRESYTDEQRDTRFVGEVFFLEADLLNLASVCAAVDTFKSVENYLNILVNNAGVMALPYAMTEDGFEIQMQTNYVAPFLLTTRLLSHLENTARLFPPTDPPRIVYVSSIGHQFAFYYFNMNLTFNYFPNIIFTWFRYGLAKTAGIHFMKMLALRNPLVLCMSVHPGFVMNTNLFSYWTRLPIIGIMFWCFFQVFGYFFGVSVPDGANATVKCCLDPNLSLEKDNGKYYAVDGVESTPSRIASNMDYAARTWIWTVHSLSERNISIDC